MKILFLADNFPPERNAQASLVFERACYWVQWGHEVTVITCAPNFPEGRVYDGYRNAWHTVEEVSGIRVVRVKTFIARNTGRILRILDYLSYMSAALVAGLFEAKPEIIVATSPQFFAAVGGCALAALRGLPFAMEVRDLWPDSIVAVGAMNRSAALRWIEKLELFLYQRAALVVVLTAAFRENLVSRGVPDEKVRVILSGVDLNRYSPVKRNRALAREWGIQGSHFVIGYIGTFGMAHGLGNVLDAAEQIQDPEIRFMLVGTGHAREELTAELEKRGLKNVLLVPAQPKEKIRDFWGLCNVSLVHLRNASLFKTVIPSKIFESMGMGLPVLLAAPAGEASRIVESEKMGLCVAAEDPAELAHAAIAMKQGETLLRQWAHNSREAASRYSREKQSQEMVHALELACYGIRPLPQPVHEPNPALTFEQESQTASASLLALAETINQFTGPSVKPRMGVGDRVLK